MQTLFLDVDRHDRKAFDCGIEPLNRYLQQYAGQQAAKDHSRTYILEGEHNQIAGFYTLTMVHLTLAGIPGSLQKKHQSVQSAGLVARLAIDKCHQGKGYGGFLLHDALSRLYEASMIVGFPIIFVDVKDGKADFYRHYGFQEADGKRMYITVNTIGKMFD